MAKVNHDYLKETTFLSPIGQSYKSLPSNKREFTIRELKKVRESLNDHRGEEKIMQKSR